ncbi:hypothetical protein AB0758_44955 [Tolypothrix bouteillei VB521301_2]
MVEIVEVLWKIYHPVPMQKKQIIKEKSQKIVVLFVKLFGTWCSQ